MRFIESQKQRASTGQIAFVTIRNYYKAIKLLCDMNELVLGWKKITKGLPKQVNASNDRIPTLEEIKKLLEYPDRRIKPIIFTIASSGIRLGAWDFLKWKHIVPLHRNDGVLVAAKIIVYAGENEQYYSFITLEAYLALKEWKTKQSVLACDSSWENFNELIERGIRGKKRSKINQLRIMDEIKKLLSDKDDYEIMRMLGIPNSTYYRYKSQIYR